MEDSGRRGDGSPDRTADQPDELLATGRPLPAWARTAIIVGVVVLCGYLLVRVVGHHDAGGTRGGAATGPTAASSPNPALPGWRALGGRRTVQVVATCGDPLGPLAGAATGRPHTSLRLLVGGVRLQRVDFDSGRSVPVRLPRLGPDEWIDELSRAGRHRYAETAGSSCGLERRRVLAIRGADATSTVTRATPSDFVADERHAWTVVDPGHRLRPVGGGRAIALPAGFAPAAATDGVIVGNLAQGMDPAEIGAVRAATGALLPTSGVGSILGAAAGRYVWSAGCGPATGDRCALQSASVSANRVRTYRLPRPPGSPAGAVSPDGRTVAFTLTRASIDPYHRQGNPSPASDVALLDLRSSRLTLVPHLELPSRYQPHLAFSPSGHWLVIAATDNGLVRLYAWRPGLARPLMSPIPQLPSPAPPPVQVLSG